MNKCLIEVIREHGLLDSVNFRYHYLVYVVCDVFVDFDQLATKLTTSVISKSDKVLQLCWRCCPEIFDRAVLYCFVEVTCFDVAVPDQDADVAEGEDVSVAESQLL